MGALVKLDGREGESNRTGLRLRSTAAPRRAFSTCEVVNMTFFVSLGLSIGVQGEWQRAAVNSERLINPSTFAIQPCIFWLGCDPSEERGEGPGCRRPRERRRLIPNELLTEFFE